MAEVEARLWQRLETKFQQQIDLLKAENGQLKEQLGRDNNKNGDHHLGLHLSSTSVNSPVRNVSGMVPNNCADLKRLKNTGSAIYAVQQENGTKIALVFCDFTKLETESGRSI